MRRAKALGLSAGLAALGPAASGHTAGAEGSRVHHPMNKATFSIPLQHGEHTPTHHDVHVVHHEDPRSAEPGKMTKTSFMQIGRILRSKAAKTAAQRNSRTTAQNQTDSDSPAQNQTAPSSFLEQAPKHLGFGGSGAIPLLNSFDVQYTAKIGVGTSAVPKSVCEDNAQITCLPPPQAQMDV